MGPIFILIALLISTVHCEQGTELVEAEKPVNGSNAINNEPIHVAESTTVTAEKSVNGSIVINNATIPLPELSTVTVTPVPVTTTDKNPTTKEPLTTVSPISPITANTTLAPSTSTVTPTNATTVAPVTTPVPPTVKPTVTTVIPVTSTTPGWTPTPHKDRHFDGASFIGGIILAVGLMGIGFIALKFYRARAEQLNYHTL